MTRTGRVTLVLAAPFVMIAFILVAETLLPAVQRCPSIYCGSHFDSGAVDVFGHGNLTLSQTVVIGLGIAVGAYVLARGLLPRLLPWTSAGFAVLSLAFIVALTLPSVNVGPTPQVPCSTPGPDGPIAGVCTVGQEPSDDRLLERGVIAFAGMACLAAGVLADRRTTETE